MKRKSLFALDFIWRLNREEGNIPSSWHQIFTLWFPKVVLKREEECRSQGKEQRNKVS